MPPRRQKKAPPDPFFEAEIAELEAPRLAAAAERRADFAAGWAKRLERGLPPLPTSVLHHHDDKCRGGSTIEFISALKTWYRGYYCLVARTFIPEESTGNPNAAADRAAAAQSHEDR